MRIPEFCRGGDLEAIATKVASGERLNREDGMQLLATRDLGVLGALANAVRTEKHGKKVYFTNYLNLNPTNICDVGCLFCSFAVRTGKEGGYRMSRQQVQERVAQAVEDGKIREVHIVGGLDDGLSVDYYLDIVAWVKEVEPSLFVKAYTAVEIDYLAKRAGTSNREILIQLKDRGLDFLPGGGAEIFSEEVRRKICIKKIGAAKWLDVHREAHKLDIRSNCTMLYGHIESPEDRIDHILRLRDLQDETGGFNSFIPLAYQDENNALSRLVPHRETDGQTDIRIYAISRLLLDNFSHIKAYWTTIGIRFAQSTFSFGVDDLSGTAFYERIMHDAGASSPVSTNREDLVRTIEEAGFEACEVVSTYDHIFA